MTLQDIIDSLSLDITNYEPVHGGDINRAYCLYGKDGKYFLKVNEAERYPLMFQREAEGLTALRNGSTLAVPQVLSHGAVDGRQYLLMEWLEKGTPQADFWEQFGAKLAKMHKKLQSYFGWETDNYIGSLPQSNQKYNNWHSFYSECRIKPLVRTLHDMGLFSKQDVFKAESFCVNWNNYFLLNRRRYFTAISGAAILRCRQMGPPFLTLRYTLVTVKWT